MRRGSPIATHHRTDNGGAEHAEVRFARRPRRRAVGKLLAGVLCVVLGSLAVAAYVSDADARADVLALREGLRAGEALTAGDLTVVSVGSGDGVALVSASRHGDLVGRVAPTDLPAGMLIPDGFFGHAPPLPGEAVVGVTLPDGELPVTGLAAGAAVLVVETRSETAPVGEDAAAPAVVWLATVFSTTPVEGEIGESATFVSLKLGTRAAPQVATAAAQKRVRLVLVSSADDVPGDLLFTAGFPTSDVSQ